MNIKDMFGLPKVENYIVDDRHYNLGQTAVVLPNTYVGIELEIEGCRRGVDTLGGLLNQHEDGSLRNNGVEAVTCPMKMKFVEDLLHRFFTENEITERNYSDRCSTHVHVNVQDMTMEQVRSIALVYQTVERLLFHAFIGEERENNIYCVPWYQAGFTVAVMEKLALDANQIRHWVKYTALNMLPIREKGTIEFRHLKGTCDVEHIMTWLNLIGSIVKYGSNTAYDDVAKLIMEMNTVSNYEMFIRSVFGEYAHVLMASPNYQNILAFGVVDSKLLLVKTKKQAANKYEDFVAHYEYRGPAEGVQIDFEAQPQPAIQPLENYLQRYAELMRMGREAEALNVVAEAGQRVPPARPAPRPIRRR
jgi:hypothetical protein